MSTHRASAVAPKTGDVVITRACRARSYHVTRDGARLLTFDHSRWTEARLAAARYQRAGSTLWFVDALIPIVAQQIDVETGMVIERSGENASSNRHSPVTRAHVSKRRRP